MVSKLCKQKTCKKRQVHESKNRRKKCKDYEETWILIRKALPLAEDADMPVATPAKKL